MALNVMVLMAHALCVAAVPDLPQWRAAIPTYLLVDVQRHFHEAT